MTITSQPTTPTCAPWCNDHQSGDRYDYCNRLVAQLGGGEHEYVEISKGGDETPSVYWSRTDSNDVGYVRALGRALLEAADTMEQVGELAEGLEPDSHPPQAAFLIGMGH